MHMMHTPARYHIKHGALSRILIVIMMMMVNGVIGCGCGCGWGAKRLGLGMLVAGDVAFVAVFVVISHGRARSQFAIRTVCFSCVVALFKAVVATEGVAFVWFGCGCGCGGCNRGTVAAERCSCGVLVAGDVAFVAVVVVISHVIRTFAATGCFSCVVAPLKVFEGVAGIVRKRDLSVGFDFGVVSAEAIGFGCDEGKCCAKKDRELHICLRGWVCCVYDLSSKICVKVSPRRLIFHHLFARCRPISDCNVATASFYLR